MIRLISHCHTHHSFDSSLRIESIISEAIKYKVNAIVVNDHDIFSLSEYELSLFNSKQITILHAIEFTTNEGVHVIGVHDDIKNIERAPYFFTFEGLINNLIKINAKIIFPHPCHTTGVYGNKKISTKTFESAIKRGDAFETDNYRYGLTSEHIVSKITQLNPSIIKLIGSDAHNKEEVAAFINEYDIVTDCNSTTIQFSIFNNQPSHLRIKKRSKFYFQFKKFQKSNFYQNLINLLSSKTRKKIKSFIKFGK